MYQTYNFCCDSFANNHELFDMSYHSDKIEVKEHTETETPFRSLCYRQKTRYFYLYRLNVTLTKHKSDTLKQFDGN